LTPTSALSRRYTASRLRRADREATRPRHTPETQKQARDLKGGTADTFAHLTFMEREGWGVVTPKQVVDYSPLRGYIERESAFISDRNQHGPHVFPSVKDCTVACRECCGIRAGRVKDAT
jgi:hypothetical protein